MSYILLIYNFLIALYIIVVINMSPSPATQIETEDNNNKRVVTLLKLIQKASMPKNLII